jgi:hypothetical protein
LQLFLIIFRRLYVVKKATNIRRAYRASNAAERALGSRASYQNCNLLIEKLNIKLKMMRIAMTRAILTLEVRMRVMRSNSVLIYIQISMSARTASLK